MIALSYYPLPAPAHRVYTARKPKGLVCEDTFSEAVATPTDKRGFVAPRFRKVLGGMGLPARMAARLLTCLQHPAHLLRVKAQTVDFHVPEGAESMTETRGRTAPTTTPASKAVPAHHLQALLAAFNAASLASGYIERGNFAAARRKLVQALASVNQIQEGA
jgi:hypothetical protein